MSSCWVNGELLVNWRRVDCNYSGNLHTDSSHFLTSSRMFKKCNFSHISHIWMSFSSFLWCSQFFLEFHVFSKFSQVFIVFYIFPCGLYIFHCFHIFSVVFIKMHSFYIFPQFFITFAWKFMICKDLTLLNQNHWFYIKPTGLTWNHQIWPPNFGELRGTSGNFGEPRGTRSKTQKHSFWPERPPSGGQIPCVFDVKNLRWQQLSHQIRGQKPRPWGVSKLMKSHQKQRFHGKA